jgi:hypothetical protein
MPFMSGMCYRSMFRPLLFQLKKRIGVLFGSRSNQALDTLIKQSSLHRLIRFSFNDT